MKYRYRPDTERALKIRYGQNAEAGLSTHSAYTYKEKIHEDQYMVIMIYFLVIRPQNQI